MGERDPPLRILQRNSSLESGERELRSESRRNPPQKRMDQMGERWKRKLPCCAERDRATDSQAARKAEGRRSRDPTMVDHKNDVVAKSHHTRAKGFQRAIPLRQTKELPQRLYRQKVSRTFRKVAGSAKQD